MRPSRFFWTLSLFLVTALSSSVWARLDPSRQTTLVGALVREGQNLILIEDAGSMSQTQHPLAFRPDGEDLRIQLFQRAGDGEDFMNPGPTVKLVVETGVDGFTQTVLSCPSLEARPGPARDPAKMRAIRQGMLQGVRVLVEADPELQSVAQRLLAGGGLPEICRRIYDAITPQPAICPMPGPRHR